ncbi:hypothetical protein THAOC_05182 [Thalassiosira oceanica]|uniref:RRP15-like protein n=1 Tax=Thalassiosira oceanica TaxID=159749 RepID=K0T6E0_THAOC|nr:hypothetical protein THAOC_05182 [Thalassiosira oceanica]|eukprot:EJK73195.1 hypothetical protein THAOC_05182 [Thalassiosira oceanica]
MVRHHKKGKKSDKSSAAKRKQVELEEQLADLDRFAGSSDDEDSVDPNTRDHEDPDDREDDVSSSASSYSSDQGEDIHTDNADGRTAHPGGDGSASSSEDDYADVFEENMKKPSKNVSPMGDGGDSSDGNSDDEDIFPQNADSKSAGLANAMSRILGGFSEKRDPKSVILSKTTTPLQRLQQKIKSEEQELKQKRQNRREQNLSCMRVPLAPTAGMSAEKLWKQHAKKSKRKRGDGPEVQEEYQSKNAVAIANEIESERTHRRIATRGVVALFNAISKHRAAVAAEAAAKEEEKRRLREEGALIRKKKEEEKAAVSTSKFGFLDMIKKSASTSKGESSSDKKADEQAISDAKASTVGWNALKDDYMMGSKLKDWDKMSDDESDEAKRNYDSDSSEGDAKRQKL